MENLVFFSSVFQVVQAVLVFQCSAENLWASVFQVFQVFTQNIGTQIFFAKCWAQSRSKNPHDQSWVKKFRVLPFVISEIRIGLGRTRRIRRFLLCGVGVRQNGCQNRERRESSETHKVYVESISGVCLNEPHAQE